MSVKESAAVFGSMKVACPIIVRRSGRRSISIEITPDAAVLVRAPYRMPNAQISQFLKEKSAWIQKHLDRVREKQERRKDVVPFSKEELQKLADQALEVIPPKVASYASILQVDYGRITIRNQKTRWGSCSSKGNLNFNCLLMLAPADVLDYVIVHELAHRKEMNHSKAFWRIVESVLPDFRQSRQWLKENGEVLMERNVLR